MNPVDTEALMLLAIHMLALGVACGIFGVIFFQHRRAQKMKFNPPVYPTRLFQPTFSQRPTTWLAIHAATPGLVQHALGLSRSTPCSWDEGMAGEREFFISPRINNWIIVTGVGLPNPDDDVDACFLFLAALSRKLGHVQFFHAGNFLHHHAWARINDGCVARAYAWAGETIWNQGAKTAAEMGLGMKCLAYGEKACPPEAIEANCDKVPLLAARWSLDPARIRMLKKADGIAGESSPVY